MAPKQRETTHILDFALLSLSTDGNVLERRVWSGHTPPSQSDTALADRSPFRRHEVVAGRGVRRQVVERSPPAGDEIGEGSDIGGHAAELQDRPRLSYTRPHGSAGRTLALNMGGSARWHAVACGLQSRALV